MRRLLIVTASELTRDPRARRQVAAGRALGLDVVGLSGRASGEANVPLDGVTVVRAGRLGRSDAARESGLLGGGRSSSLMREARGLYRLARLALRTAALVRTGRRLGAHGIVHANDLDTLPAAWLIARRARARLVYDAHELYSAFEVDPPRLHGLILGLVEAVLARRAACVVTVSEPLGAELQRRLRLRSAPIVVLNLPELDPREPEPSASGPLRVVYQGSFGTGRPLRALLDAVSQAPHVHVTVRAPRADSGALSRTIAARGLSSRVDVADPVPPDRVADGLRGHHAGVIFDDPVTLNGTLSLPNKLFEYLMAGLAVVVPRLPAVAPLVEGERVGLAFEVGSPAALAGALERLAADRDELAAMRRRARRAAVRRFHAETQTPVLARVWGIE